MSTEFSLEEWRARIEPGRRVKVQAPRLGKPPLQGMAQVRLIDLNAQAVVIQMDDSPDELHGVPLDTCYPKHSQVKLPPYEADRYWKTVVHLTVLTKGSEPPDWENLSDLEYHITDGDASGGCLEYEHQEVNRQDMRLLLVEQGSDPNFLDPEHEEE